MGASVEVTYIRPEPLAIVVIPAGVVTTILAPNEDGWDSVEIANIGANAAWLTFLAADTPAAGNGIPVAGSASGTAGGEWYSPFGQAVTGATIKVFSTLGTTVAIQAWT